MIRRAPLAANLAVATLAAGCSFAPKQAQPVVVADIPEAFESAPDSGTYRPREWWTVFNDSVLNRLVDTALAANLDLREAVARVEEVRQRYRIVRADLVPSVTASAEGQYTSSPANVGIGGEFGTPIDRFEFETYSASLGLSYEVDFWGRASNDTKAAASDFLATEADYRTAQLAVISATISTYLEIVDLRRQVALAGLNVELLAERADLTDQRYYRGLTSSFELYTFRSLYRNAQAGLPVLYSQLAAADGRMAVLLGRYAGSLDDLLANDEHMAPAIVVEPVPADLPAALLEDRPDVLASWRRMESARFRIGARKAELYPAIRLNAGVGLQSSSVTDLFRVDQYFVNLLGGLTAPLLQGGRLRANASASEAVFQQRAAAYVRTVLTAYSEVETSLQNLANQQDRYDFLLQQRGSAQGSVDFQLRSLERGVGSYIEYLDARRNLVGVETNLASAERALGEGRLAVHRALGGGWVSNDDLNARLQKEYRRLEDDLTPVADATTINESAVSNEKVPK